MTDQMGQNSVSPLVAAREGGRVEARLNPKTLIAVGLGLATLIMGAIAAAVLPIGDAMLSVIVGLAGVGLFFYMLTHPVGGLFIVVFVTFAFPWPVLTDLFGVLGSVIRLTAMVYAASFFVRLVLERSRLRLLSFSALPLAVFFAWRIFQVLRTRAPEAAQWISDPGSIPEFSFRLVMYLGLYILVLNVCRTRRALSAVGLSIVLPVFVSAIFGLFIYLGFVPAMVESSAELIHSGRVSGLRAGPLETAGLAIIAIGILLPFLLSANRQQPLIGPLQSYFGGQTRVVILFTAIVVSLLMTGSRAGLIGFTVLLIGNLLGRKAKIGRLIPPITIGMLVLIFMLPLAPQVLVRLTQIPGLTELIYDRSVVDLDTSASRRWERLLVAPQILQEQPLIGAGYGNYELEMAKYLGYGSSAHNLYAEIAGEEGIIGLMIYLALLARILLTFVRSSRVLGKTGDITMQLLCLGFMWSFVGFNIDRVFQNGDSLNKLIFLYLGISDALGEYARTSSVSRHTRENDSSRMMSQTVIAT